MRSATRRTKYIRAGMAAGVLLTACSGLVTQAEPPANDVGALKEEVAGLRAEIDAMRNDLRVLLQRIGGQPAPRRAAVATGGGVALGDDSAPVTLVEFSDYQCPYCRRFHEQTFPRLKTQYIDTGKMRYVFRDFPLDSIHPQARKAAEAAHCAGEQGKYWGAHDLLFQNQQQLLPENLKAYAQQLGLDTQAFNRCFDTEKYRERVQENQNDGVKAAVRGTPAFFVGKTGKDGSVDGLLISGARPYEDFQQEIDKLLNEK